MRVLTSLEIDVSQVRQVEADMRRVDARLAPNLTRVMERGAFNIKTQLRDEMRSSPHFRSVARSVSYEWDSRPGLYGVLIGPEMGSPGSLANIAYFGGANGGGGTVPDPRGALNAEADKFMNELAKKAAELVIS